MTKSNGVIGPFRWSEFDLSDDVLALLPVAEEIAGTISAEEPKCPLLDDEKLVVLAEGLSALSSYFPEFDPVWGPPTHEPDTDYAGICKKLLRVKKQAEKLNELLLADRSTRAALEVTFSRSVDQATFFDEGEVFMNWPDRSLFPNEHYEGWLEGLTVLQSSISDAIALVNARASMTKKDPTKRPSVTIIRGKFLLELFQTLYPFAPKGGTRGGNDLEGPIYTFHTTVLKRMSDLSTTPASMSQAVHRLK